MSTLQQTPPINLVENASPGNGPGLIAREREALREILRLVSERAAAEAEVERVRATTDASADRQYDEARKSRIEKFEHAKASEQKADETRRRSIIDAALAGEADAKSEFARASRKIASDFDSTREKARNQLARDRADASALFELTERAAVNKHAERIAPINNSLKIVESMRDRLAAVFADYAKFGLDEPPTTPTRETYKTDDLTGLLIDRLAKLEPSLKLLEELFIPKSLKGRRFLWIFIVIAVLVVVPSLLLFGADYPILGALIVAIALGFAAKIQMYKLAKTQVSRLYYPLFQSLVDAEALAAHDRSLADEQLKTQRSQAAQKRDADLQKAKERNAQTITAGENERDERLRRINEVYAQRQMEIQTKQQVDLREAIDVHDRHKAEIQAHYEDKIKRLDEKYHAAKQEIRVRYETAWGEMATRWRQGMERAQADLDAIGQDVNALGLRWDDPAWNDRAFPKAIPPVVRFGDVHLDLATLPDGVPADPRLRDGIANSFTFPSLYAFPAHANLLIETPSAGRAAASTILQATMLRLLTSLPPGQVRFTIIDPVGIGRNFGAFMHLADFDPALVTQQVWTDARQIEERLTDLAAHMEKVTQKYLRNEYATIEEYNAVAEEVAEPYRILVIADFPTHFDEKALSRLSSIAANGIPCGVLILLAVDRDRPIPEGFSLDEFRANAVNLTWDGGQLVWTDPDFGAYPLALDPMPSAEFANRLIHRGGAAARDAKRVEVPFEFIAPAKDSWWTKDSRTGIDVPLGKAGATKRQNITLGHGTSQHVLIAGRTGSGKSTLMHALITNLILNYSPDEIELYLIDFKKGVEFKVYATHELPHAGVVAIESEREFGISVLQRLDGAMRERADRFRDAGVQDVNGYRNVPGTPPLPRLLLIVDEFQEFFVEEDKVAQEAAQLLDRLVRQGRAFGVHVHLGSQSLGGAYALARTTLGQMAVRIALQCSDADAHLILSEQNPAAQMLTRPGEAVYNDANGQPEGNHFFQVVWLSDERREYYLTQVRELAQIRKPILKRVPIVFEGDSEADLSRCALLKPQLEAPQWPPSPRSAHAWLGEAVAIKDPTSALFRRQAGNHLLIVGQNEEAAIGIVAASIVSLAAQFLPAESETVRSGARFAILDGTPEDHPHAEFLAKVARTLPHPVEVGNWRDVPRILSAVAAEVERRQQPDTTDGPEIFLVIHDVARFREIRRNENDFGFSRREEASPADQFATILREGPGLGIHVLIWCDTVNNLNRVLDHQMLREFEMRVLFQMSPTDSGHLIDAPHASKLGPHRAFFASEEQNRLEKFRPYAFPPEEWLDEVREQFRRRTTPAA